MRKVIVNEFLSLDGVAQAPGAADEDTSGGFGHGGRHLQFLRRDVAAVGGRAEGDVAEAVAALEQEGAVTCT